jgi:SagB-type dehydrogenase family enzyme
MTRDSPLDDDEFLYEHYHKNLAPLVSEPALAPATEPSDHSPDRPGKSYRRAERLPLAEPKRSAFLAGLRRRRSYTDPTERRPITDAELSTLLRYAYGELRDDDGVDPRRPVPSGGACYPLELYPIVLESPDVEPGIYHYDVRDDALERLQRGDYSEWVRDNWTWIRPADTVSAVVVITALPERSAERYGEMGYLFAGIETGAVVQNLQLVAAELGLGSRPHNGLNYRAIRDRLRLRDDEFLLSTVAVAGTSEPERDR